MEEIVQKIKALIYSNVSRCPELEPFRTFCVNFERKRRFVKAR